MKADSSPSVLKTDLNVLAVLAGLVIATFVFRDSLGLWVFIVVGLAALVQLFRVVFLRGDSGILRKLWDALKDGFWGIG
jgi:hypothetical protein